VIHPAPGPRGIPTGLPRAARLPSVGGLLVAVAALLWFSPLALVCWLVGQLLIARQTRWHWHRFALAALGGISLVLVVSGPVAAIRRHFFVPAHLWQYVALWLGYGPEGTQLSAAQIVRDLLVTQVWLAVPVGLLAASLAVYAAERAAGGAEWNPLIQRRMVIDQRVQERTVARLLTHPRQDRLPVPPLGVALDGDLPGWVHGHYVVPPAQLRGKAMAVIGAPGAGKTVTLARLAYLAGFLGRKVAFVDCKGTDPTLGPTLIAAYLLGNPAARVGQWPATPMDMWRGTPTQVASRLLAVEEFTEPFYERVASAALRLALTAPTCPRSTAPMSCCAACTPTSWPTCGTAAPCS
jgi:hypothetical protein